MVARNSPEHRSWAREAAATAREVLPVFETERSGDSRPRLAIEAIDAWARGERQLGMNEVRRLSLDAHAAARECGTDAARYAARAAGQAVAVWHVPTHARAVASYVKKAFAAREQNH